MSRRAALNVEFLEIEHLVPHMTTKNQNSHMAIPGAHVRVGRGLEPVGRQGPETSPKCWYMYGPCWALKIDVPKQICLVPPPPPLKRRRERYIVLHMWKIYCGIVPNDVGCSPQPSEEQHLPGILQSFPG